MDEPEHRSGIGRRQSDINMHSTAVVLGELRVMVAGVAEDVGEIKTKQASFLTQTQFDLEKHVIANEIEVLARHESETRAELRETQDRRVEPLWNFYQEIRGALKTLRAGMAVLALLQVGFDVWAVVTHH